MTVVDRMDEIRAGRGLPKIDSTTIEGFEPTGKQPDSIESAENRFGPALEPVADKDHEGQDSPATKQPSVVVLDELAEFMGAKIKLEESDVKAIAQVILKRIRSNAKEQLQRIEGMIEKREYKKKKKRSRKAVATQEA